VSVSEGFAWRTHFGGARSSCPLNPTLCGGRDKQVRPKSGRDKRVPPKGGPDKQVPPGSEVRQTKKGSCSPGQEPMGRPRDAGRQFDDRHRRPSSRV